MTKQPYKHSRSGIFLMEIIIAILFFAIASAICLNVFVHSHQLSAKTEALNHAVNQTSSLMEILKTGDSADDAIAKVLTCYPDAVMETGSDADMIIYDDDNYAACSETDAAYKIELSYLNNSLLSSDSAAATGQLITWTLTMSKIVEDENPIYTLTGEVYYAQ